MKKESDIHTVETKLSAEIKAIEGRIKKLIEHEIWEICNTIKTLGAHRWF